MSVSTFARALLKSSGNSTVQEEQRIFDPFLGSWSLAVRWFDTAGRVVRQEKGEWHFATVLEDRAIQDVWIVPPRDERGDDDYEYGTSVRFFDPAIAAWRSIWIGPMRRAIVTFIARRDHAGVLLESCSGTSRPLRWTFHDISDEAFRWSNEERAGRSWYKVQTFQATRLSPDQCDGA